MTSAAANPSSTFAVTNKTRGRVPSLPFVHVKDTILGEDYDLSLVLVGDRRAQSLNMTYRGKSYIPNVLSFPLSKRAGEIVIDPAQARRECARFAMTEHQFVLYLFIHGCLHLKGVPHGDTMDALEARYLSEFSDA